VWTCGAAASLIANCELRIANWNEVTMQTFYQRQLAKAREAANNPLTKTSVFIPKPIQQEEETIEVKSLPNSINISTAKNSLFAAKSPTAQSSVSTSNDNNLHNTNPQNKLVKTRNFASLLFKEFEPKIESYENNSSNPFEYRSLF
jgi:DNA primase